MVENERFGWRASKPWKEVGIVDGSKMWWINAWRADGPKRLHRRPAIQIGEGVVVRKGG